MRHFFPPGLAVLAVLAATPAPGDDNIDFFGDARVLFFASEREARSGETTSEDGLQARVRLGLQSTPTNEWLLRGRLAGRYSTEQDRTRMWLKSGSPSRTGLEEGDATLDELFMRYAPEGANWWLRAGRFQTQFALKDLMGKSLDRNDSPNVGINWTDGVHWRYAFSPDWQSHLIVQSNPSRGHGGTWRAPLDFDDDGSRVSLFTALESTARRGPIVQRVLGLTWLPDAMATDGVQQDRRNDYVALTARVAAEWPIGTGGMRAVLGGELGYAPTTPADRVMNAGGGSAAGGDAGQFSVTLFDFAPHHDISAVYGWADAGWLISPDFRQNDDLLELRYRWRIDQTWSLESRVRRREERGLPDGVNRARIDDDFYFRVTARF